MMQILDQKYRPQSKPLYKRPITDSFVDCPWSEREQSIRSCFGCKEKVKVNFNNVHCGYGETK